MPKKKTTKTKKKSAKKKDFGKELAIGAGVAALAAAGYFLFGPSGEKNRKKIKGWTLKMKGEVLDKMEEVKEITEPVYNKIVDNVAKKYLSKENKKEVEALVKDLKSHWKRIAKNSGDK